MFQANCDYPAARVVRNRIKAQIELRDWGGFVGDIDGADADLARTSANGTVSDTEVIQNGKGKPELTGRAVVATDTLAGASIHLYLSPTGSKSSAVMARFEWRQASTSLGAGVPLEKVAACRLMAFDLH